MASSNNNLDYSGLKLKRNVKRKRTIDIQKCLIVFGSFLIYFISDGVTFSFGILIREFRLHYKQSVAATSFTAGLSQAIPLFASPFVCLLIEKYGCRPIALIGSFLVASSFVLTKFFAANLISLYIILGGITGIGLAMSYIPAYLIISFYFNKRRALATGIAVSGSGLGTFAMPPLMELLIREYGWLNACFIFGAIASHMFIAACLFRPLKNHTVITATDDAVTGNADINTEITLKNTIKAVKKLYSSKRFIFLNISYAILSAFITAPYNFLPDYIRINEINDANSYSISIIGISTLVGQIIVGFLSDKFRNSSWLIYSLFLILSGVVTCFLPFIKTVPLLYTFSALFGFGVSVNYALQSILVIESTSLNNLTLAFGCLQLMQGFATLFGVPFVAFLMDYTRSYNLTFYVSGSFIFFSGFLLILWPFLKPKKQNKQHVAKL